MRTSLPIALAPLLLLGAALTGDPADGGAVVRGAPVPGGPARVVGPVPAPVREALGLSGFYAKAVLVDGFPIVASERVNDYALLEAAFLVRRMTGERPDVLAALVEARVRFAVMAWDERTTDVPEHADLEPALYWDRRARGLGATRWRPAVSCGEENLLGYPGDPYATENILIHEFAHAMHQMGLDRADPEFDGKLRATYEAALAEGLWEGTYAATNKEEYWAEGVQSWFDTNREDDDVHNHVDTRAELVAYDPRLAELCRAVYGDGPWRYAKPGQRDEPGHLAGYDPSAAPRFAWSPEELAQPLELSDEER